MGSADPDPALVAAALNRYAAARTGVRHGAPGAQDDLACARDGLVRLLRQAGWQPPDSGQARHADEQRRSA